MATRIPDHTTITAAKGVWVHALLRDQKTACNRAFAGWRIVSSPSGEPGRVTCQKCKLELLKRAVQKRKRA